MALYGLIGYPLSHSFSKKYFTEKFEKEGLSNYGYENFSIDSINKFEEILASNPDLRGLNVTIPYKELILPFLTDVSAVVREIGACNCIRINKDQLEGFNTDVTGFRKSFKLFLKPHHRNALVLGTGGAAKAVGYVLHSLGIQYQSVSRQATGAQLNYNQVDEELLSTHHIIINTTPLGMQPDTEKAPDLPYQFLTSNHYLYDVVYNPGVTRFLQMGKDRGAIIQNGLEMLRIQAEESWKIWNNWENL